jgi:hypothetical protein
VRVIDPHCFDLIVAELDQTDGLGAARLAQALSSLRAVSWSGYRTTLKTAFGFIERHAAALTELDCSFSEVVTKPRTALACCARLESLTNARAYDAKAWLGLTHLHTLRGVNLAVVSVAAIAAALPRLHTTLAAFINEDDDSVPHTAVAGFFEDLVPHLRALHYHGPWPVDEDQAPAVIVPQPLPLLIFWCPTDHPVARGVMGAQPVMLHMLHSLVADMLLAASSMAEVPHRPLARVRDLCLAPGIEDGVRPNPSDVARLLRAAPQLRKFNGGSLRSGLDWLDDSAFAGLVHPWLRSVRVEVQKCHASPPVDYAVQLRRLHFPRLQQLSVNSTQHLVHVE